MTVITNILKRESLIACRRISQLSNGWLFFLLFFLLFPLCLRPDPLLLQTITPVLYWVAMLIAILLSIERVFTDDYQNGILEHWMMQPYSFTLLISIKLFSHWLVSCLPLVLFSPLLALLFNFSMYQAFITALALLIATPTMVLLCALASAFTLQQGNRGILMALVVFPCLIPVLIFGAGCIAAVINGQEVASLLALLAAISLIALSGLPFAISAALRISLGR